MVYAHHIHMDDDDGDNRRVAAMAAEMAARSRALQASDLFKQVREKEGVSGSRWSNVMYARPSCPPVY